MTLEAQTMIANRVTTWLREEHAAVDNLLRQLKTHVADTPSHQINEWLYELATRFSRLKAHMARHFAMEESGGFLTPVLEARPTLATEVEHLKHEHAELRALMANIEAEIKGLKPDDCLLIDDACHRIQHLIMELKRHQEHEELLLTFVFSQDLGGHN